MITATDFKPRVSGALKGFVTLRIDPPGFEFRDVSFFEKDGRCWIGLPGRPLLDAERQALRDDKGKIKYSPVILIPDKETHSRFQKAAVEAIEALLGEGLPEPVHGRSRL